MDFYERVFLMAGVLVTLISVPQGANKSSKSTSSSSHDLAGRVIQGPDPFLETCIIFLPTYST